MDRRRSRGSDFGELVTAAYEAAGDAALWPAVARKLAAALMADSSNLTVFHPVLGAGGLAFSYGLSRHAMRQYSDYFWSVDAWRIAAHEKSLPVGVAVAGETLVAEAALVESELYRDYMRFDGHRHYCGGYVFHSANDGSGAGLGLLRAGRRGRFQRDEVAFMNRLMPHFRNAIGLWTRFESATARAESLSAYLDARDNGYLVAEDAGRLVEANSCAERLLADGDGIRLVRGRLTAASLAADARLQRAIDAALAPAIDHRPPEPLALPRPPPRPPLIAHVMPLRVRCSPAELLPQALVVLRDPEAHRPGAVERVARAFRLTAAEARLLERLVDGETLKDAAEHRGISVNTARNQLRQIFQKTGAGRQSDLIRLVLELSS